MRSMSALGAAGLSALLLCTTPAWAETGSTAARGVPVVATTCTITPATTRIVAGEFTKIAGTLTATVDGSGLPGRTLRLYAQAYGEDSPSLIASDQTGAAGDAELGVIPVNRTRYYWLLPGGGSDARCQTNTVAVDVATKIGANVADSTLNKGQTLTVSGKTYPAKKGARVGLWRRTASGPVLLASTRVQDGGRYLVAKVVRAGGSWRVFTKVAARTGNLVGTSVTRTVTVS